MPVRRNVPLNVSKTFVHSKAQTRTENQAVPFLALIGDDDHFLEILRARYC